MPEPVPEADTIVFDAYGTLFDVAAPVRAVVDDSDLAERLAVHWRGRQLEYAWTDAALGRPPDFWSVTARALRTALEAVGRGDDDTLHGRLLDVYAEVDAYDDAVPLLESLRERGVRTIVYSNANQPMLEQSVRAAGLADLLDDVLSVDRGGVYKPAPAAYRHLVDTLALDPDATRYVSSNAWDVAGAARAGFVALWVDRGGSTWPFGDPEPSLTVRSLGAVA